MGGADAPPSSAALILALADPAARAPTPRSKSWAIYYYTLDNDQPQLIVDWVQLVEEQQAAAAMTSTDTIALIISDLNRQRDARGVVDTDSVLSILARINVLFWREYGDQPLSADSLPQLGHCA